MTWIGAALRILAITVLAGLVGGFYGHALAAIALALAGCVGFWLIQMQTVQQWLEHPEKAPPDVWGIWGDLIARIYSIQRVNRVTRERLEANVVYLQDSFSSMRDGVVMVEANGSIKWLNHAAQPLLGLRYPQDTGQVLTNLVRSPEFNRYFLGGDYSVPLQYTSGGEGGRHLRVEITHFGEGERLLFVRDVSAEVRMEQIRRDFVANVSHELRTPLTVISGYLGTFMGSTDGLPERYIKPLKQMNQQAERMESLLKDLLWLSRIESEKREAKRELVDIRGMLQELREEMSHSYEGREVQLTLGSERKVLGDYRELYSAVSNLVTNALKYSPHNTPVMISWSNQGERSRLSVRDQGIGIDPVLIPRLTERFYRVDDSRNSATGGTGLGLAIVKHVAEAHDALLTIDSEPGKGSIFTLEFPGGEG